MGEHSILWESPLWSLACEEIYYALYPLLRITRNRIGWKRLLPVWLLGCLLAEQVDSLTRDVSTLSIWFWRFLAWLGCWTAEMLHFKGGIPYTQTMIWFGVVAYFWLRQELARGKVHAPNRWLVAGGAWSYSLYLLHPYGGTLYGVLGWQLTPIPTWFLVMAASLLVSYVFYLLVERPSHKLARKIRVRVEPSPVTPADQKLAAVAETEKAIV